jgi:DNA gyrase/topoisomerase IV subunit B/DNA gyrase/topoisomerase IV subunit A
MSQNSDNDTDTDNDNNDKGKLKKDEPDQKTKRKRKSSPSPQPTKSRSRSRSRSRSPSRSPKRIDEDETNEKDQAFDGEIEYTQLGDIEHVLTRPDMYIGSVNLTTDEAVYVLDPKSWPINSLEERNEKEKEKENENEDEEKEKEKEKDEEKKEDSDNDDNTTTNTDKKSKKTKKSIASPSSATPTATPTASPSSTKNKKKSANGNDENDENDENDTIINTVAHKYPAKFIEVTASFSSALLKIIDEIFVNAHDARQRDKTVTQFKISIDRTTGRITVFNNGCGIPVRKHDVLKKLYIPEMIFGELRSGGSFDKAEKENRTWGGRNGLGAKLTNILSTEFTVETVDSKRKRRFKQTWKDNMKHKGEPIMEENYDKPGFVKLSFIPDYKYFKLDDGLDDVTYNWMCRRVFDLAGSCAALGVRIDLNGQRVPIKTFQQYMDCYELPESAVRIYDTTSKNKNWEIGVAVLPNADDLATMSSFQNVSFVNGIHTVNGGTHVAYILDQITKSIVSQINSKAKKNEPMITERYVRPYLFVFVKSIIINPDFSDQAKTTLKTKRADFGSTFEVTPKFIKKILDKKTGLVDAIRQRISFQVSKVLKKSDGDKIVNLSSIPKLDDANWAGTAKSALCVLFLTEGDSAKSMIMSGMPQRQTFGVFPLRGKFLNVRDASVKKLENNTELAYLKKILGLKQNVVYEDVSKLRYGKIVVATDQDTDGSHIGGLIMNLFGKFWPSLLEIPGFLNRFKTPVVTAVFKKKSKSSKKSKSKSKSKSKKSDDDDDDDGEDGGKEEADDDDQEVPDKKLKYTFSSLPAFEVWKQEHKDELDLWDIKYYKGLGTSSDVEAREYFENLDDHIVELKESTPTDFKALNMAFSKKEVHSRKEWLARQTLHQETLLSKNSDVKIKSESDTDNSLSVVNASSSSSSSSTSSSSSILSNPLPPPLELDLSTVVVNAESAPIIKTENVSSHGYNPNYTNQRQISIEEFIENELSLFGLAANCRSIPSMVDGLKTSQRKILFSCLKRRLIKEIKVAALSGYVTEHAAFHHGEQSLHQTIIGLAQSYTGANNVQLLQDSGQFGKRNECGKDAASARYISTFLSPVTRNIFVEQDDTILTHLNDDGAKIEPIYYLPVIPFVLVNGVSGIGFAWSTDIPSYNPYELIDCIKTILQQTEKNDTDRFDALKKKRLVPFIEGFKGRIYPKDEEDIRKGYVMEGVLTKHTHNNDNDNDTITLTITEIPVTISLSDYKEKLQKMRESKKIMGYTDQSEYDLLRYEVRLNSEQLAKAETSKKGLLGYFCLIDSIGINNMTMFDEHQKLHTYKTVHEVIEAFFKFRFSMFAKRKAKQLEILREKNKKLSNQFRFILQIVDKELTVQNVPKEKLLLQLEEAKYDLIFDKTKSKGKKKKESGEDDGEAEDDDEGEAEGDEENESHGQDSNESNDSNENEKESKSSKSSKSSSMTAKLAKLEKGYNYLNNLSIQSLTKEKVEQFRKQFNKNEEQYKQLENETPEDMWLKDLNALEVKLKSEQKRKLAEREKERARQLKRSKLNSTKELKLTQGMAKRKRVTKRKSMAKNSDAYSHSDDDNNNNNKKDQDAGDDDDGGETKKSSKKTKIDNKSTKKPKGDNNKKEKMKEKNDEPPSKKQKINNLKTKSTNAIKKPRAPSKSKVKSEAADKSDKSDKKSDKTDKSTDKSDKKNEKADKNKNEVKKRKKDDLEPSTSTPTSSSSSSSSSFSSSTKEPASKKLKKNE